MPGRFPAPIPETLEKGLWTRHLGTSIKRWMMSIQAAVGGLEGTPIKPTENQAGVAASIGASQAAAASDHQHPTLTAAPGVPVALGGASDEGSGAALMRADARLVLSDGGAADGQFLVWDQATQSWVPRDLEDEDILVWFLT